MVEISFPAWYDGQFIFARVSNSHPYSWLTNDNGVVILCHDDDAALFEAEIADYQNSYLPNLRIAVWQKTRLERDRRAFGGCATPTGPVDTDESAKLNISGAVVSAMLSIQFQQPFAVNWTMSDNSRVIHDASQMIAMGQAVSNHIAVCHTVAANARDWINDPARTMQELLDFDPETLAWP